MKRNKGGVAAGVAVLLAIVVGTGVATWQAANAIRFQSQTTERTNLILGFIRFCNEQSFGLFPSRTYREQQLQTVTPLLKALMEEARNNPLLREEIAQAYVGLAHIQCMENRNPPEDMKRALSCYRNAIEVYSTLKPQMSENWRLRGRSESAQFELATTLEELGRYKEAATEMSHSIELCVQWASPEIVAGRYRALGRILEEDGQSALADEARECASVFARTNGK